MIKTAALTITTLSLLGLATMFYIHHTEWIYSQYPNHADISETDFSRGWLPAYLPETAQNIHEIHNLDSNCVAIRFDLKRDAFRADLLPNLVSTSAQTTLKSPRLPRKAEFWLPQNELHQLAASGNTWLGAGDIVPQSHAVTYQDNAEQVYIWDPERCA